MACAFGMEVCKRYFNTKYVLLPDMLINLEIARTDDNYRKVMDKYANPLEDAIIDCIVMTVIASTSQALMQSMTDPYVRYMV